MWKSILQQYSSDLHGAQRTLLAHKDCIELVHASLFTQHYKPYTAKSCTTHNSHLHVVAAAEAAEVRHLQVGDDRGAARHHALYTQQLVDVLGVQAAHARLLLHAVRPHLYAVK